MTLEHSSRASDTDPYNGYLQFNNTSGTNDQRGRGLGDEDEPVLEDERTPNETGNRRRRDNNPADEQIDEMMLNAAEEPDSSRDGGSGRQSDGGDGGGGGGDPARMDGKWESPLHRTRVKLSLKLSTDQRYAVAIGYTFKVHRMHLTLDYRLIDSISSQSTLTWKYLLTCKT